MSTTCSDTKIVVSFDTFIFWWIHENLWLTYFSKYFLLMRMWCFKTFYTKMKSEWFMAFSHIKCQRLETGRHIISTVYCMPLMKITVCFWISSCYIKEVNPQTCGKWVSSFCIYTVTVLNTQSGICLALRWSPYRFLVYVKKRSLSELLKLRSAESSTAAARPISNMLNRMQAAVTRGKSTIWLNHSLGTSMGTEINSD